MPTWEQWANGGKGGWTCMRIITWAPAQFEVLATLRHDEGITVIREKADRLPDFGRYETHANLGSFLVHSGRLEEGVAELQKAIEINPDAHFGREK